MDKKQKKEIINIIKTILNAGKDSIFFKTNLYKSSKDAFKTSIVDGAENTEISIAFTNQARQIIKAEKLIKKLNSLSDKVSYLTSCAIEKYINYLETGLQIYENGKDNESFDQMFADLNNYVENCFVKLTYKNSMLRAIGLKHKSFRELNLNKNKNIKTEKDCYSFAQEMNSTLNQK